MMIDTTDQQAVTVAQEDREAGLSMYLFTRSIRPGDRHYETACASFRNGSRDEKEAVQAFARHRLASVSSASAETPERKETLSERQAREVMNPGFGSAVGRSDGTAWNAAASNLQKAQVAPEPVPATNQAGEVALRDAAQKVVDAAPVNGNDRPHPAEYWAGIIALRAALATQPATSQEGTARDAVAWLRAKADGFREAAKRQERRPGPRANAFDDAAAVIEEALCAATPTPPTLSEDLREALRDQLDDVDDRLRNGALACSVMLGKPQAEWLRAALAQVQAS